MQRLYVPHDILKTRISLKEQITNEYSYSVKLSLYPTKDYFDLVKHKTSEDCTRDGLGARQLKTRNFFNIRVFARTDWIGNIYMLDLLKETGSLLIDRIQIPRQADAEYIFFFQDLTRALQEMFADVGYTQIIAPLTISNHATVQNLFNSYKKKLKKIYSRLDSDELNHFESLSKSRSHYVLCSKS